jgi:hypothetical protein
VVNGRNGSIDSISEPYFEMAQGGQQGFFQLNIPLVAGKTLLRRFTWFLVLWQAVDRKEPI